MLKKYLDYYKNNPQNLWFKRKIYGLGWTPVKWQGWLVITVYVSILIFLAFNNVKHSSGIELTFGFILPIILLTFLLIYICRKKGESLKWTWGIKNKK